jgi:hypothetical protein
MLKQWFYVKDGEKIYSSKSGVVLAVLDSGRKYGFGYSLPKMKKGRIPSHFAGYKRVTTIKEKLNNLGIYAENIVFNKEMGDYKIYTCRIQDKLHTVLFFRNLPYVMCEGLIDIGWHTGYLIGYNRKCRVVFDVETGRDVFSENKVYFYRQLHNWWEEEDESE